MGNKGDKSSQLGMPYTTAVNKLRKNMLFEKVKQYGENVCSRCHKSIDTVEDFSLEHKQKWLGKDASLFWSTENVCFAHVRCNREISLIEENSGQPET